MADKQAAQPDPTPAEQQAKDIARVAEEAEQLQLDTTVPGGRYLVKGQLVDSEGRPVKDKG